MDETKEAIDATATPAPLAPAADPELEPRAARPREEAGSPEGRRTNEDDDEPADEPETPLDPETARREALDKHFVDVVEFERVRDVVARHCATALGRKVLRRMKPLRSREQAQLCLEQTDEMVKLLRERERVPLADLHDAGGLLRRAIEASRPLEAKELRRIAATLDA